MTKISLQEYLKVILDWKLSFRSELLCLIVVGVVSARKWKQESCEHTVAGDYFRRLVPRAEAVTSIVNSDQALWVSAKENARNETGDSIIYVKWSSNVN